MEGRPIAAHDSLLFRYPTEILSNIVGYLGADPRDLASLALVNSDCRQLARSWQFRNITLDGSPRARAILDVLVSEAYRRAVGVTPSPSLGACVRHINTSSQWLSDKIDALRPRDLDHATDSDDEETKLEQWRQAYHPLCLEYERHELEGKLVISSLPHLHSLALGANVEWEQFALSALARSSVRHLKMRDVTIAGGIPFLDEQWPLETLDISFSWEFQYGYEREGLNASQHWNNVLRICAPTLQSLRLSHRCMSRRGEASEKPVLFNLRFPKLRFLDLEWESLGPLDEPSLRSLILTSDCLSTLVVDFGDPRICKLLKEAGRLPSLKTLVLNISFRARGEVDNASLDPFLCENPQLTAFATKHAIKADSAERTLSWFCGSQLTKLSMSWEGTEIPDSSLAALSNISSLEDLHMDCVASESQNVWIRDWYVDHTMLRASLGPSLGGQLKRLAFTRDIYAYPFFPEDPDAMTFSFRTYTDMRGTPCWQQHLQRMREQVIEYAKVFPRMEFIHLGELSFVVSRDHESQVVLDMTDDRNFCWQNRSLALKDESG